MEDTLMTVLGSLSDVPPAPGKYKVRIPVTTDLNGLKVVIWVHALVGDNPGPTLTLLSGLHGNEWLHLEFFQRFVEDFEPAQVSGTVLVIPMANAVAFGTHSRQVRDDSDNADANRSFPGPGRRFTWLAEQIATSIAANVFPETNYLIDFHLGVWGSTMGSTIVFTGFTDEEVSRRNYDLSLAFGSPLIFVAHAVRGWAGSRTSAGYAGENLKIPSLGSSVGGAGFDRVLEAGWHDENLAGIRNVMIHAGMLQGEMQLPEEYLVYEMVHRTNPRVGGVLSPVNAVEEFGRPVQEGELLGTIINPFTFETVEELRAPVAGYLAYWARSYPIRPGEWAYAVIPADHEGTPRVPRPAW
jgi:predicted deacylase